MPQPQPQHEDAHPSRPHTLAMRKRERKQIALPLTPMIDVTFLLLLYFLLTSTFRDPEQQLMGSLPSPGGAQSILLPIHIAIEPAGPHNEAAQFQIDEDEPTGTPAEVYTSLASRAKRVADPEVPVVIHVNEDVRWAHVIEVFNAASSAGFSAVTFAPSRPPGEGPAQ